MIMQSAKKKGVRSCPALAVADPDSDETGVDQEHQKKTGGKNIRSSIGGKF